MPTKNPQQIDKVILKNGGVIETEAGTDIISVSSTGEVTIASSVETLVDLTTTGNTALGNAVTDTLTVNGTATFANRIFCSTAPVDYTHPSLSVGVYGTPVVDTAVVDNIAFTVNMSTATNKTSADTSTMAAYFSASNTAATANNKLQSILGSTVVNANCYDAYGVQGHITLADNAGHATSSTGGTGNLCGMSAKATVASGLTATGTVSGLLVTADGTGTVTGAHSGIWIDNVAATDQAILISGSNKLGINMNGISISAGAATDDAGIKTAQGATAPAGSIYISTNGTIFVMVTTTWTALTIN
jgi:hypothetical protein